jgi:hypothetical protein
MNSHFIIGGDFNAKHTHWDSRLITTEDGELYKAVTDTGCEIVCTDKPTYWPTDPERIPDLIDFFVIKNISKTYIKIEGFGLNSDHSPISLKISDKIITKDQTPVITNKHTDWHYFNYLLDININLSVQHKTADQIEKELNAFKIPIQEVAWNSTPVIKTKLKGLNFPKCIKKSAAEKRKFRRNEEEMHLIKIF